jgi:hypothetical protein
MPKNNAPHELLTIEPLLNVLKLTFEWVCTGGKCGQYSPTERGAKNG